MNGHESRPEVYGDGISYASPALLRMMDIVQYGGFDELLTEEGYQNLFERLSSVDLDTAGHKVLIQVYFKDPSKVRLQEDEAAFISCEYEMWPDAHEMFGFRFNGMTIPAAGYDPLYDERLGEHMHLTVSDEEINWDSLRDYRAFI